MTSLERPLPAVPAEPTSPRRPRPSLGTAVLVVSVGIYLWLCWELRAFVTDDSWISVRYAENLANGHGFVWNPGGPRVEGYSNPLLVMIEALADLVGIPAMRAARGLGVLSGLACLVVVSVRGQQVIGRTGAAAATVLLACSAPIAVWAVGGLETLPMALLITVATLELARRDGGRVWLAAGAMALLPWLRPEGLAAVTVLVAISEGPGLFRRATRAASVRRLLVLGGVPVASQVLLEAFRLGVYGHLLPNSVIYKAGHGEPFEVAEKFLAQGVVVLVLAVVGLALSEGRQRLLVVPPVVYLIGSIGMADSVNGFSRFFMPIWPQVALLAGLGVAGLLSSANGRRRWIAVAAVVAASGAALLTFPPGDLRTAKAFAQDYQECRTSTRTNMAAWLRTTPQDTVYSISDAGLVPARAGERTAIDSFTLNEALIQERGRLSPEQQADEVFRRQPDVVIVASSGSDPNVFVGSYPNDQMVHDRVEPAGYRLTFVATGNLPSCAYSLWAYQR
jgi:arabinofuranosyltransferase